MSYRETTIDDYSELMRGLRIVRRQIDTTLDYLEHGCQAKNEVTGDYEYYDLDFTMNVINGVRNFLKRNNVDTSNPVKRIIEDKLKEWRD